MKKTTRYGYVIKNTGEFVLRDAIEVASELNTQPATTRVKISSMVRTTQHQGE